MAETDTESPNTWALARNEARTQEYMMKSGIKCSNFCPTAVPWNFPAAAPRDGRVSQSRKPQPSLFSGPQGQASGDEEERQCFQTRGTNVTIGAAACPLLPLTDTNTPQSFDRTKQLARSRALSGVSLCPTLNRKTIGR